jgi:signal transduction histidine kinase
MKLLTRTVRNYVLFSTLLLMVCTPVFYFFIQRLFVHKIDQELLSHKEEFHELLPLLKTKSEFDFFGRMNDELLLKESPHPLKADSFVTETIYNDTEKEMHPYRILRTGVIIQGRPYVLQIQESMVSTTELISAIVVIQAALIALLLIGFVLINRKLSITVWRPFYITLDKLKKYQIDRDNSIDLPPSSTDEFRDLSVAISQLINRNYEVFQSQKEFTENAAHELQTPLAICRTKLELLAQTKELTREQADLVVSLLDATDRITRLNKDLLLLARIENRQFFETDTIELRSVVTKCLEVYDRKIREKKLSIRLSLDGALPIKTNPVLAEVLVNNIISNAIRHTTEGGAVIIDGTKSFLIVSNSGEPLGHPEKIFQRFHRGSRSAPGTGLGLSIVKKICEVSGYRITYDYTSSMHHFKISFAGTAIS